MGAMLFAAAAFARAQQPAPSNTAAISGVVVDAKRALQWLHGAAEHGDARAQTLLGVAYHDGADVVRDV